MRKKKDKLIGIKIFCLKKIFWFFFFFNPSRLRVAQNFSSSNYFIYFFFFQKEFFFFLTFNNHRGCKLFFFFSFYKYCSLFLFYNQVRTMKTTLNNFYLRETLARFPRSILVDYCRRGCDNVGWFRVAVTPRLSGVASRFQFRYQHRRQGADPLNVAPSNYPAGFTPIQPPFLPYEPLNEPREKQPRDRYLHLGLSAAALAFIYPSYYLYRCRRGGGGEQRDE